MSKDSNSQSVSSDQKEYKPVKPFAFEAWKIWNKLTTDAQVLWRNMKSILWNFALRKQN